MTMQDAAAMVTVQKARQAIMTDPTLTLWGKVKGIESIDRAVKAAPQPKPFLTPRQVVHGAVGAGLGWGVAKLVGGWLGVGDATQKTLNQAGIGLGTLLNAGAIRSDPTMMKTNSEKIAEVDRRDRQNAVMLGFLKGAVETGLIDNPEFCARGLKKGAYVAVTPDLITSPVRAAAGTTSGTAAGIGGVGAHILGEDETDEDIQKMMLEKRMLEVEADRLNAQRRNRILQRVLRRRIQPQPARAPAY